MQAVSRAAVKPSAAECEAAVHADAQAAARPLLGHQAVYYPLLEQKAVDQICAASPPPPLPAAPPKSAAPPPASTEDALDAGVIAGIVVGGVAGVLLLLLAGVCLCRGRGRNLPPARKAPV